SILLAEKNIALWSRKERSKQVQIIYQDPYASLNPRMNIENMLSEVIQYHRKEIKNISQEINKLLALVQLPATSDKKYPHEFSGGQRQRICIARALAVAPQFVICDESVAALDINIREQILQLFIDIQK